MSILIVLVGAWFGTSPIRAKKARVYFETGSKYFQEQNDRQAIIEYKKALILDDKADYFFALGEVYFLNQNYSQAESYFNKALRKNPQDVKSLFGLSETLNYQQKFDQALRAIESKNLTDSLWKIQLARLYLSQEKDEKAQKTLENQTDNLSRFYQAKILLYEQDYLEVKNKLALVEAKNDQKRTMLISEPEEKDIQVIIDAAQQSEKIANLTTRKVIFAEALNQTGDAILAGPILKKVAEGDPTYRDSFAFLGHSYILIKNFEAARDALLKAKELDPVNYATWIYLGKAYEGLGNEEMAKTCMDKAEKLK